MAKRTRPFSSKTLDERFEAFLKESVSSEDDSEQVMRFLKPAEEPKESTIAEEKPWWATGSETDNTGDVGKGTAKFLKSKQPALEAEGDAEVQTKVEVCLPVAESLQSRDSLEAFKQSAAETTSATLDDTAGDSVPFSRHGEPGSSSSSSEAEQSNSQASGSLFKVPANAEYMPAASMESTSVGDGSLPFVATLNSNSADIAGGDDTIEETAEKKKFFEKLEADEGGSPDYAYLNKALDMQATLTSAEETPPRQGAMPAMVIDKLSGFVTSTADHPETDSNSIMHEAEKQNGDAESKDTYRSRTAERSVTSSRPVPAAGAAVKPSLLANVSLRDTMSTLAATTDKVYAGALDNTDRLMLGTKPPTFGYTTSQEMDAVREAYKHAAEQAAQELQTEGTSRQITLYPPAATSSPSTVETQGQQRLAALLPGVAQALPDSPFGPGPTAVIAAAAPSDVSGNGITMPAGRSLKQSDDVMPLSPVTKDGGDVWTLRALEDEDDEPKYTLSPEAERAFRRQKKLRRRKESPSTREVHRQLSPSKGRTINGQHLAKPAPSVSPQRHMGASRDRADGSHAVLRQSAARFAHIASSGYGKQAPARDRSQDRPPSAEGRSVKRGSHLISPQRPNPAIQRSEKSIEDEELYLPTAPVLVEPRSSRPVPPAAAIEDATSINAGRDKFKKQQPKSSIESFATYIHTHFARASEKWVPPIRARSGTGQATFDSLHTGTASSAVAAAAAAAEDALRRELREWIERWEDEKRLNNILSAHMQELREQMEKKITEQQTAHDEEVLQLKRDAAFLKAKFSAHSLDVRASSVIATAAHEDESSKQRKEGEQGGGRDSVTVALVEEQERLLEGYQRENERLYTDLKKATSERKMVEDGLLRDNHRLASELALLREQLETKDAALRSRHLVGSPRGNVVHDEMASADTSGAALGAARIAELSAELKQSKLLISKLQSDIDRLERVRNDLETRNGLLAGERDRLIEAAAGRERSAAAQVSLEAEVERLSKKVRWYAENQELLDRDAQRLKEKDTAIEALREQLRHAQSEAGQKQLESKAKAKEKSSDAKRIQDLERQVKELEGIIRKRNPNSLPALMMAAAATSEPKAGAEEQKAVRFLEDCVRRLERELEGKDSECKVALRAMEQRLGSLKEKYEERIATLERDLQAARSLQVGERPFTTASALQHELDAVRESYKKKLAEARHESECLRADLDAARQKLQNMVKASAAATRNAAVESVDRLGEAEAALEKKHTEVASLLDMIERLQLEKRQLTVELGRLQVPALADPAGAAQPLPSADVIRAGARRPVAAEKGRKTLQSTKAAVDVAAGLPTAITFVPQRGDYAPQNFADLHVDDILRENEQLKAKVERLELDLSQQRVDQQRALAELEVARRREHEELLDEMSALKRAHQAEIEKIIADHAAFNSSSKITELSCRVEAQEVIIKHLKDDRERWRTDADELAASRIRELALRAELQAYKTKLDDAKRFHTPEMRHYDALVSKISEMETRNVLREREIRQLLTQISDSGEQAQYGGSAEAMHWQRVLQAKNLQVESFRSELDSILHVLRDLKRSGVKLPMDECVVLATS